MSRSTTRLRMRATCLRRRWPVGRARQHARVETAIPKPTRPTEQCRRSTARFSEFPSLNVLQRGLVQMSAILHPDKSTGHFDVVHLAGWDVTHLVGLPFYQIHHRDISFAAHPEGAP